MAKDKSPLDVVDPTPIPQPDPQPAPVDPMDVRAPATTTAPAQPALDPIDKGLDADADQRTGAQEALLKSSMLSAMQDQPDKQAQILKLNDKLGFSNIVDKQTFDAASQQEKLQSIDYRRMLTAHPELAKWLTIRSNAAVAHDEVPQLQAWSEQAQRLDGTPHDTNGILPDGYIFQKDGTIRGPVSAEPGKEPVIYKSLDVLRAKLLREEGQQYTDQFVADAAAKVLDQHWFPSLFAGAEGSVSGTLSALSHVTGGYQTDSLLGMTMPEMKVGSEQIGAASEQLNPGFTGSMGRVVGQLVGDAPLYLLGGEVAGLADLATSLRAIKAATALPETVPSIYLKDAWKTALAYSPIAARSGINTGSEHGAAYGSLDFLINAIGPASFGSKFGLANAIVPGAETAAASAGWMGVAQRLMVHAGSQGGIMAATELANALHEYATGVDPDALKQENLLPRLGQSFAMGSALSTAFHISSEVGGHYRAQQVAAHAAMMDAGAMGRLMEASEALKVPERTPAHFQELLEASIPESQRIKLYQTDDFEGVAKAANVTPEQLANQMGIGAEYKKALATGQMMTVPTHLLLKWGMEHEDPKVKGELLRAARSNAMGINVNEALKFYKESPDQLAQQKLDLESDVTKTAAGLKESDPIFHDIMTKYEEAGQVSDAARTNAKLMAAFFHVQAKRWNFDATARGAKLMDPQEEYENSHLQVVKGGHGNYVEAMDALLNRVREGNVPTEKQAYGKSLTEYLAGRGIKDENGALKKIGADTLIDENGHDLELAAERAHDEGYIEDADPQTLLDAIKQEAGGRPVFASANRNEDLHQLRSGAVALAQHLASKGINIASPNEQIKAALAGDPMMARFEQVSDPPAGWRGVSKHLTEKERENTTNATAAKMVKAFADLPDARDFVAAAKAGAAKRGWYRDSAKAILDVFGPEDSPRFTALLAALSPQTSVEINLLNAVATWKNWLTAGRPTNRDAIVKIMGKSVQGTKGVDSVLPAWINNAERALKANDPSAITLSGPKVDSFMRNLRGVVDEVTNDAWMANFAHIDQAMFGGSLNVAGTDPGKGFGYKAMAAKVRQAAAILTKETGETWTPAEVQETVWSWTKTLYEMADAKGETRSERELVKAGEVTDEKIASTPDFATQLTHDAVLRHLEEAGYGKALDRLAEFDRSRRGTAGEDVGQGRASLSGDDQRALLRSAKRLEELRAERDAAEAAGRAGERPAGRGDVERPAGEPQGVERLEGAPKSSNPQGAAAKVARSYMESTGRPYAPPREYVRVLGDPAAEERGRAIASAYEAMEHKPGDPKVKAAYAALARETIAQYDAMIAAGHKVEAIPHGGENPYKTSADMAADAGNGHSWYFRTEHGFGSGESRGNPLLADSGRVDASGNKMLVNDVFRVVHDYYGHAVHGTSFGANGEENAWRAHAAMYSEKARGAMTTETRGQNSWVNFGPKGEENRADPSKTIYAEQKTGLMPGWVSALGVPGKLEQRLEVPSAHLRHEYLLKQWKKAHGDRSPTPGDKDWQKLVRQADMVDAANGRRFYQGGDEGAKGSLEFDSSRHFVMTLNGNADLSTVAHEAGHFWLEKMGEFAMREGAPPQMRSDYQKILEFVGYGTHENKNAMMQEAYDLQRKISSAGRDATASEASRMKELADPHEKFARSIEQYLMEGHAPSPELRGAFQRFAIWLGHIYRQVKSLVTLTPEVRGIFDRLLATDDAIEQVQKELGTSTIFKDQASSGMKDEQWASYLASIQRERERSQSNVFAKAMATLRRENTRAYNREKDRALSRAAEIIKNRPVNIIVNEMVNRVDRDGNEIAETPKLSRADVEKNYGAVKELPRGITQDEGGMSLEAAADAYHFGSAAELWTALANYRKPREQIAEMADAFIKAEHPELTPEALHEAAMEAVHANNAHADVLGRESAALAIRALRTPIPQEQMKQIAERMVAETNHRDVKPEVHLRAEIKASDQSTEAFLKEPPDYTAAFLHKQRQELSHALYRASMEAQEVIEKTGALMKKLGKYETRQMLGRAGGYVIVGKNGERFVTMDEAEAASLAKEYDGRTMNFRDAADELGDMWDDRPTRFDMDFGAVSDLYQEATAIHFQAKTAFDLIVQGKKEDLAQAIDSAIKSQKDATGGKMVVVPRDKRTFRYKLGDFAVRMETGNRTLHGILRSLDGEKADGWHYRNIGRPLNEAQDDEVVRKIANAKEMRALTKDWGKRGRKDPVFIPSIGESLNLEQRIGVALNAGTRHNLERMQTGDGWTTAQIKSIISTLDEKDIALVKGIWGLLASKWPEISAMHTKTEGVPPDAKETIPVETRFGTIDGGYYPILYDKARGARAFELSLEKPASPILGKPGSGFTKTSLETTGMKLQYGFDALFRHLDDTAHYLSHKEAQVNINKIVNNRDFQQSVVDHFGIRTFERMAERIQNVLQGPRGPQNAFEEGARFLRTRSGLATCGYNAMTVLVHGFGIPQSMHVVGMGKWLGAQGEICASAGSLESAGRFIDSKSSFMKNSHHNVTPETAERLNQGMAGGVLQTMQDHALDGLHLALRTINRATWLAEYRTRMEEMPNDEPRAIELANQAVRDTQGSGQTVDKTYFQDANEFSKMFMQYASFFTRTYQLLRPSIAHFDKSDPATYWAAMKAFLPLVMLPAVTEGLFREAIKPSSDNDNSPEFWATRLAKDNIEYLLSTFIGGREVSGMVEGFDYKGPASMRSLGSVGAAFGNIKKFLEDADSSSANRAGRSALGIAGLAFGIPSNQIDHIIQGILHDQDEGSANPLPLLFGPPRN